MLDASWLFCVFFFLLFLPFFFLNSGAPRHILWFRLLVSSPSMVCSLLSHLPKTLKEILPNYQLLTILHIQSITDESMGFRVTPSGAM